MKKINYKQLLKKSEPISRTQPKIVYSVYFLRPDGRVRRSLVLPVIATKFLSPFPKIKKNTLFTVNKYIYI